LLLLLLRLHQPPLLAYLHQPVQRQSLRTLRWRDVLKRPAMLSSAHYLPLIRFWLLLPTI